MIKWIKNNENKYDDHKNEINGDDNTDVGQNLTTATTMII